MLNLVFDERQEEMLLKAIRIVTEKEQRTTSETCSKTRSNKLLSQAACFFLLHPSQLILAHELMEPMLGFFRIHEYFARQGISLETNAILLLHIIYVQLNYCIQIKKVSIKDPNYELDRYYTTTGGSETLQSLQSLVCG